MDDRIHFIEHKGKQILLLDFSHANAHEMQLLLEHVRITVAQHARQSVVTLGDFTGATVDHAVATKLKEVLTLDRPFVRKAAWVVGSTRGWIGPSASGASCGASPDRR